MRKFVPFLLLFGLLMLVYKFWYKGDAEGEQQLAKKKVDDLWARPLPWYPTLDSITGGLKTSPDGVKMPIGWSEL